jgi:hypothetical protein
MAAAKVCQTNEPQREAAKVKQYHKNPRQITAKEYADLQKWLAELGDLGGVVHDLESDQIIGGNQRSRVFDINHCEVVIEHAFDEPDEQGTVGLGYVIWQGKRYAYRQVRWDERQCEKANIVANKAGGAWDWDEIANSFEFSELQDWGFDKDTLKNWKADVVALDNLLKSEDEQVGGGERIYSDEQIIDAAFEYFRKTGFPYRNLPVHVSMQEINKLALTETESLARSVVAYQVADTYNPHRFHTNAEGMKSQVTSFLQDTSLRKAIALGIESGEVGTDHWGALNMVNGTQACANFRPGFACYLYRKYCPPNSVVLDTSTGYGGRLVGAIASCVVDLYIGIDPNTPTHEGNTRMANELGFADKIELYNLPAEDMPHDKVAGRCDFAFTSPPYFSKEHYSEDDTQSWVRYKTGDEWRSGFLRKMLELQYVALKPGSFAIVNIADVNIKNRKYPLEAWTVEDGKAIGFEYVRTERFELTRRFGAGMADEVASEPVIVFMKPLDS